MQEIRDMEKLAEIKVADSLPGTVAFIRDDPEGRRESLKKLAEAGIFTELNRAQDEKVKQQVKQQVEEIMNKIQPGAVAVIPPVSDGIGRLMWTVSCVTEELRRVVNHLPTTEQNEHARLALRHLEDAHHRLDLARAAPGQLFNAYE